MGTSFSITQDFRDLDPRSLERCARCGTCRSVCPVMAEQGWESSGARGRILVIKGLMKSGRPDEAAQESLFTCTTCGRCKEICPAGVNPPLLIERARSGLVSAGFVSKEQASIRDRVFATGNTFGEASPRLAFLRDRSLIKEKADCVFFVGCLMSYRYPETAARTADLLKRFGVSLLPDEKCCGSPLLRMGFDADESMNSNLRQIEMMGANTVVTSCAGCYTTLKNNYSTDFQVLNVSEFLADRISELELYPLSKTVTYHDPCHLGRCNGIFDPPRKIVEAICELQEMKASRDLARCCGGGGGVRAGYKDLSLSLAEKRLEDVPEGVNCIVTSCPLCIRNLSDAAKGKMEVIDVVDLVAESLDRAEARTNGRSTARKVA